MKKIIRIFLVVETQGKLLNDTTENVETKGKPLIDETEKLNTGQTSE